MLLLQFLCIMEVLRSYVPGADVKGGDHREMITP